MDLLPARLARRWRRRGAHHALGTRGEILAERALRAQGYRIIARNAKTPAGEVDLVAEHRKDRSIVIAEVKTRSVTRATSIAPERSVNAPKRARLLAITTHLRRANGWLDRPIRIDIIVVEIDGSSVRIRQLRDAVRG